jgi:signal transduction histidine kinase
MTTLDAEKADPGPAARAPTGADLAPPARPADRAAIALEERRLETERVTAAVLRERERLAGALHDSLSQLAFSLALHLDWCLLHCAETSELHPKLVRMREKTAAMMAEIRRLVAGLSAGTPVPDPLDRRS